MISVTHRVLTLKHTMKSFVALFVVVAVVAVNAVPVEKDATTLKQDATTLKHDATTLKKDAEVQPQNNAGTKVQESGNVKNVGQGEHLPVTPASEPCYRVTVTEHIKEPEKLVPVLKEPKA